MTFGLVRTRFQDEANPREDQLVLLLVMEAGRVSKEVAEEIVDELTSGARQILGLSPATKEDNAIELDDGTR